jgi:hypothetical protein
MQIMGHFAIYNGLLIAFCQCLLLPEKLLSRGLPTVEPTGAGDSSSSLGVALVSSAEDGTPKGSRLAAATNATIHTNFHFYEGVFYCGTLQ